MRRNPVLPGVRPLEPMATLIPIQLTLASLGSSCIMADDTTDGASGRPMTHDDSVPSDEFAARRAMVSSLQKALERWPDARASSDTITLRLNAADVAILALFLLTERPTRPKLSLTRRRR